MHPCAATKLKHLVHKEEVSVRDALKRQPLSLLPCALFQVVLNLQATNQAPGAPMGVDHAMCMSAMQVAQLRGAGGLPPG